jgi:hypothetical protein
MKGSVSHCCAQFLGSIALAALSLMCSSHALATILEHDFQGDPLGPFSPAGNAATFVAGTGATISVVSGANDVFGGGSNQSLKLDAPNSGSAIFYAVHDVDSSSGATTTGTFSIDFYHSMSGGSFQPFTEIKLGTNDGGGFLEQTGIWLGINGDGNVLIFGSSTIVTDQGISFDQSHNIEVDFNVVPGTFSLSVDGNPLTASSGGISIFAFNAGVSSINALELSAPSSSRSGTVYVDNILITSIPEPASVGLLMIGLVAISWRTRKKGY